MVVNGDDQGAMDSVKGLDRKMLPFGITCENADCRAENIAFHDGLPSFDVVIRGVLYTHVELQVAGKHNILNALAAAAAAYVLGVDGKAVAEGLGSFHGAGRRFEYKGKFNGADVYDDYAHHPGELHALLTTARTLPYERVICAFQPHTYTRTHALFDEFVTELQLADVSLIAEIYAAREKNTIGISSADLAVHVPGSIYCPTLDAVTDMLEYLVQPGDLVLTVGAGDIVKAGEALVKRG